MNDEDHSWGFESAIWLQADHSIFLYHSEYGLKVTEKEVVIYASRGYSCPESGKEVCVEPNERGY